MTYQRFEDLPVWQSAIRLAEQAEDLILDAARLISPGKRDQLDRCSLSVSNNIAEGFERGSTKELLAFLYIARGSAGETRSMMRFFARRPGLQPFLPRIEDIAQLAESCSRQIRAWADKLQNTDIEGPRHLNEESRKTYTKRKAAQQGRDQGEEMIRQHALKQPDGTPLKEILRSKGKL
jgi:four helix bundle protein